MIWDDAIVKEEQRLRDVISEANAKLASLADARQEAVKRMADALVLNVVPTVKPGPAAKAQPKEKPVKVKRSYLEIDTTGYKWGDFHPMDFAKSKVKRGASASVHNLFVQYKHMKKWRFNEIPKRDKVYNRFAACFKESSCVNNGFNRITRKTPAGQRIFISRP